MNMQTKVEVIDDAWEKKKDSLYSYITGFVLSLLCTIIPYLAVTEGLLKKATLVPFVIFFAIAQFGVQVIFFLHLPAKRKPYWNLIVFFFTIVIVAFLVGGSLWIMYHLNNNMMVMTPVSSSESHVSH